MKVWLLFVYLLVSESQQPTASSGKNLFDLNDPKIEEGQHITDKGVRIPDLNSFISGPIPVKPKTAYTRSFHGYLCYYAADTATVVGGVFWDDPKLTNITPPNARFVRITIPANRRTTYQFVAGSAVTGNANARVGADGASSSNLKGKRILWLGTSIPKLSGYPQRIGQLYGATVINNAISSSPARKSWPGGSINPGYPGAAWNLSSTLAEKEQFIKNYATLRDSLSPSQRPDVLSEADKAAIRNSSWEVLLKPYLSGPKAVDLIVLNHNFNDNVDAQSDAAFAAMPKNPYDRSTYVGAMNYLINQIRKTNPRINIVMIGHYENQVYPRFDIADQRIASYWKIPFFQLSKKTGWSKKRVPGTAALWSQYPYSQFGPRTTEGETGKGDLTVKHLAIPDGVHPSSDPTGQATELLAGLIGGYLNTLRFERRS